MTILEQILDQKREEVAAAKRRVAPEQMRELASQLSDAPRGFCAALRNAPRPRVIAEIKRRSPSRGEIRAHFEPVECAKRYLEGGAAALSVLTDEHFFGGHLEYLGEIRRAVPLPLLRKDFLIDPYQLDEARVCGADAVLLIVSALDPERLAELHAHADRLGLDALVEIHDAREFEQAQAAGARLVGINNRDLKSFEVDLAVTERLAPQLGEGLVIVAESGIFTYQDIARLEAAGADAVLVGEALMREPELDVALRKLRGNE